MDRIRDSIDYNEFDYEMSNRGWVLFDRVVNKELCERMRKDIKSHVERCGELQVKAGIPGAVKLRLVHVSRTDLVTGLPPGGSLTNR